MMQALDSTLLTLLLALGAQAPSQTSPRALLERGALIEEHQRDFAGAQKLYEQAQTAAKSAGDAKTAAEAGAARERVLARQGKGPAPSQAQDAAVQQQLAQRAVSILFKAQNDNPTPDHIARNAQQLVDLGPAITETLALSLTDSISPDGKSKPPHVPAVAARALALMQTPEGDRALIAAYDSVDPTIRKAVIEAAEHERFRELQLRAASDSVTSVRELAVARLLNSDDPRAAPAIQELARTNDFRALAWLAHNAPELSIALAEDVTLPIGTRWNTLIQFANNVGKSWPTTTEPTRSSPQAASMSGRKARMPSELVMRLAKLVIAAGDSEEELRNSAWQAARALQTPQPPERATILAELEPLLLRIDRRGDDTSAVNLLVQWQSPRAIEALTAALQRRRGDPEPGDLQLLYNSALKLIGGYAASASFEAWVEVVNATSPDWPRVHEGNSKVSFTNAMLGWIYDLDPAPSLDTCLAAWRRAPAAHEPQYLRLVERALRDTLKDADVVVLPADWKLSAPRLFASGDRRMVETAVNAVRTQRAHEFLGDIVRSTRLGLARQATRAVKALYESSRDETTTALEAQLLVAANANPSSFHSDLVLLDALSESDAIAIWRGLWDAIRSSEAREALVRFWVEPRGASAAATAQLVEIYPTIAADFPDFRSAALTRFGDAVLESALPILERELRNPEFGVRTSAMSAVEQFRKHREAVAEFEAWRRAVTVEETTVAELSKLLASPDRNVVLGAVKALGILRARPALPALVKLLERDDKELRAAVQAALDAIGGS